MTFYDYKVTPAPRRLKRVKGVKSTSDLFSVTLAEAINASAREGWEYMRAESLSVVEESGWFRRGAEVVETVLVFRRPRETLGPRIAAQRAAATAYDDRDAPDYAEDYAPAERAAPERSPLVRREPRLGEAADAGRPMRPGPRLGPADKF
jgi:hypothetical protein